MIIFWLFILSIFREVFGDTFITINNNLKAGDENDSKNIFINLNDGLRKISTIDNNLSKVFILTLAPSSIPYELNNSHVFVEKNISIIGEGLVFKVTLSLSNEGALYLGEGSSLTLKGLKLRANVNSKAKYSIKSQDESNLLKISLLVIVLLKL